MPVITPIQLPPGVVDAATITPIVGGDCTSPAGHCYGSDGGSGIPKILQVPPGQGGNKLVATLDNQKTSILSQAVYSFCQYCGKALYVQDSTVSVTSTP